MPMKNFLLLFFVIPFFALAEDPTNLSCDFEKGMMNGWTGDGTIKTDESGNRVYSLNKPGDTQPELRCTFTVPKNGDVSVRFRVRGIVGGKDLKLKKTVVGGGGFGHKVEANGQWVNRVHGRRDKDGSGPFECSLALILVGGKGEIQIDDIEVFVQNDLLPKKKKKGKEDQPSNMTTESPGESMSDGLVTGNKHAADIPILRSQTRVNGLLVMSLNNAEYAGSASPMTLSALRGDPAEPSTIRFNQSVGSMMSKALEEVVKFIELRHDAWPKGRNIEISFENKYNPKDGPSAAVACALLLESAISDYELDPGFAVTGDMNADGSIQPVGGIDAKIRGADNRNCTHVAIPLKNVTSVYDTVMMQGIGPITDIQVFSIANFDQAEALAPNEREELVQKSIDDFNKIAELYQKNPSTFGQSIKHPKVIELLKDIVKATPNHLSAEALLKFATGKGPRTLSLHGSTEFIERNGYSITDVIVNGKVSKLESLRANQVTGAISILRKNRAKLDERTWKWAGELIKFATLLNRLQTNPPSSAAVYNKLVSEINAANDVVRAERRKLFSNPEVMEELLQ